AAAADLGEPEALLEAAHVPEIDPARGGNVLEPGRPGGRRALGRRGRARRARGLRARGEAGRGEEEAGAPSHRPTPSSVASAFTRGWSGAMRWSSFNWMRAP